jgi:hypothetical protein
MRRVGCVVAIAAAVLAGTACDTSQPTEGSSADLAVQVEARGLVQLFDCYDRYIGTTFDRVVCTGPALGTELVNRLVPWRYSFRIVLLHGGQPGSFEIIANSISTQNGGTFPTFGDVSRFDNVIESAPLRPDEPPYNFQNARRVSQGHPDYFVGTITYTDGRQQRPPIPLPDVNILGITPPSANESPRYTLQLKSGDSVIVEAAKQLRVQGPDIFPPGIDPNLTLNAKLFVGGSEATPNAGTVQSGAADGAGLSFNYVSD